MHFSGFTSSPISWNSGSVEGSPQIPLFGFLKAVCLVTAQGLFAGKRRAVAAAAGVLVYLRGEVGVDYSGRYAGKAG